MVFVKQGKVFGGVQDHRQCYCGTNYGKQTELLVNECDRSCLGDPSQICGGDMKKTVITTGKSQ